MPSWLLSPLEWIDDIIEWANQYFCNCQLRGHLEIRGPNFIIIWPPSPPRRGQSLYPERGQKQTFFDPLPLSSCPRSYWMAPKTHYGFSVPTEGGCIIRKSAAEHWLPQTQIFSYSQRIFFRHILPKHFTFLWFMPSLGVRSPWVLFGWSALALQTTEGSCLMRLLVLEKIRISQYSH